MAKSKFSQDRLRLLKEEILLSEKFNFEILRPKIEDSLNRYIGKWIPKWNGNWDIVLNEVFPVVQYNLPAIFFRNPKAFVKPRNKTFIKKQENPLTGEKEEIQADSTKAAKTQESILNYMIEEIKYKKESRKVLTDALLFPYGVMWHGYKGDFGMTDEESLYIKEESLFAQRIAPLKFIYDPCVSISELDKARWVGRAIDLRYSELIDDPDLKIDKEKVKAFKGFGNKDASMVEGFSFPDYVTKKQSLLDKASDWFKKGSGSDFVRIYEIFIRPTKAEKRKGGKGHILLISIDQDDPLRESEWEYKAEGFPSKILEFNYVPDYKFGLSDPEIYGPIADQKNIMVNLQIRNAEELTKNFTIINKSGIEEEDIDKILDPENRVLLYEGDKMPNQMMAVMSPNANSSNELYLITPRLQRELEDKSGVTDLNRGFLQSGEESAASVQLRAAGGAARPRYRQDIMADFLTESFAYLNQLNKQYLTFKDSVRIIGSLDLEWSEDPSIEDIQMDTDVEIDAISMLPESPEIELQRYQQILDLAIGAATNPAIQQKLQQEGKTFEFAPIVSQILRRARIQDPDIFRNIKPEESMGFVSIAEVRAAEANVNALLSGQEPPSPPDFGQDHMARIEVYKAAAIVAAKSGNNQAAQLLQQFIQIQAQFMEKEQSKQAEPGRKV